MVLNNAILDNKYSLEYFLTISLKVGFLVFLEIFVLRLEVLCGSGSR